MPMAAIARELGGCSSAIVKAVQKQESYNERSDNFHQRYIFFFEFEEG
jgi:uncharacterized coiled-coil DUF342 family protein